MDSEMTLDELLADPIIRLVMDRDGVEADDVRALWNRCAVASQQNPDHPLRSASRYRLMICPRLDGGSDRLAAAVCARQPRPATHCRSSAPVSLRPGSSRRPARRRSA